MRVEKPFAQEQAMSQALRHPLIELPRGGTLRIADGQAHVVDVFQGQVWITQDGDSRDVFLAAGQSFTVDGPGLALLHAFEDSRLLVTDLVEHRGARPVNAIALHRWARARRDAALAALLRRSLAAAESAAQRLVSRLAHRPSHAASAAV
jgi:hypothetical protein